MKVKTSIKGGLIATNHNASGMRVKSSVKAGGVHFNHNASGMQVKSKVKAGFPPGPCGPMNHNQTF